MSKQGTRHYGVVSIEEQGTLSGLEFVQGLANGSLTLNSMSRTLGSDVVEAAPGKVVVTALPNGDQLNPAGTVHGGLAATLLDSCMGLAIWSATDKGFGSTTPEFKISFVRPIMPDAGPIRAAARAPTL